MLLFLLEKVDIDSMMEKRAGDIHGNRLSSIKNIGKYGVSVRALVNTHTLMHHARHTMPTTQH